MKQNGKTAEKRKTVERQCKCPDCDKVYLFPVTLKTHEETKHDKWPICMTCHECLEGISYGDQ